MNAPITSFVSLFLDNLVTSIFILFIIAVFLFYFVIESRINTIRKYIFNISSRPDIEESLSNGKLKLLYNSYVNTVHPIVSKRTVTNTPSSIIFNPNSICSAFGINLRLVDSGSSTLVGLGLLGTFLGLTLGISGFQSETSTQIQSSIQVLLSGMGTAFYTSLVGMLFSLALIPFDRIIRNRYTSAVSKLCDVLDEKFYIDDVSLLTEYQKQQVESLYQRLISHNVDMLSYTNHDGNVVRISNAIREMLSENQEQSRALKSFSTDLAIELNNGFDQVMSKQMQEKILPLMNNVDATTKAIIEHIDSMAAQVSSPATEMLNKIVDELKNSMTEVVNQFSSSLSGSATSQLESLAHTLGTVSQSMVDFPNTMTQVTNSLQTTIQDVRIAVSDITNSSTTANSDAIKNIQEQVNIAVGSIGEAIDQIRLTMSSMCDESKNHSNDMAKTMSDATTNMSAFLDNMISKLSEHVHDSIQNAIGQFNGTMISSSASTKEQNELMVRQLNEASEMMTTSLNKTASSVSSAVQESVESIADTIRDKHERLLILHDETTHRTKQLLDLFNIVLDRLQKTNEVITGTMSGIAKCQGEISITTGNLRTVSDNVRTTTDRMNQGQENYAASIRNIQSKSQEEIDALSQILFESQQTAKDYASKFEVIKNGLSAIFMQLQTGLTEYSDTVRDTTNKYLSQYSASLTETTSALSSTIERQNEITEMLTETLGNIKS